MWSRKSREARAGEPIREGEQVQITPSGVNDTGTYEPADAPPGGVSGLPVDEQNAPAAPRSYASAVAAPANASSVADQDTIAEDAGVSADDENFGAFVDPSTEGGFNVSRAKAGIVRVYDHDGDGFPEFADVQVDATQPLKIHVPLPDALKKEPNATAARVPILNPAICQATGMVVERHELVNGILPELNSPGIAYGEKNRGEGTQNIGLSNPNAGATARDMSSSDRVHERFANLESAVYGGKGLPAQPSNATMSKYGSAIQAHADAQQQLAAQSWTGEVSDVSDRYANQDETSDTSSTGNFDTDSLQDEP